MRSDLELTLDEMNTTISVSYTHLDVYKRQGLRYAIACSVQRGNALIAAAGYANSLNMSRA